MVIAEAHGLEALKADAETMVQHFAAAQPGFSEALLALSHDETLVKISEALSVQNFIGGKNFTEVVQKVFADTPLQPLMARLTEGRPGNHEPPVEEGEGDEAEA